MTKSNITAISIGQSVTINPRDDRSRKKRLSGTVAEILTRNHSHPHGILVKLTSGEVGRVKDSISEQSARHTLKTDEPETTVQSLINSGENHLVEFKTDALWSTNYSNEDIKNHRPQTPELHKFGKSASKIIIAKTLAAFLNSDGGDLIIGFKEGKVVEKDEIVGIDVELSKLKDPSIDGYRRMITELVKTYFPSAVFNTFNSHFKISFEKADGKTLCRINAQKAKKRVFLKLKNKDYFYVRVDASTRELTGEDVVEFCENRF